MSVPKRVIHLDQPNRWTDLITEFKVPLEQAYHKMISMLGKSWSVTAATWTLKGILKTYSLAGKAMYLDELREISNIVNISVEELILIQLCYEMFAACISIIIERKGRNIHYRTMDWDFDFLKRLTVELDFRRENQTVFCATSWVGYIGVLTGMIPGKYSIALNYRRADGGIFRNISRALKLNWPTGYLIRWIMESQLDFDTAKETLEESQLISPCYFSLCRDTGRSYVIVRDCDRCKKVVGSNSLLIQTNIDPDSDKNDENILWSIQRRKLARMIVTEKRGSWDGYEHILNDLNKWPIINEETIYVTLMDPQSGLMINRLVD